MVKLLEISKKLFQLAPWDYMGNEDYCQMFLENEDPLLVCVTGSLVTQNFGFIICRNALQADYFLSLKEKIEEGEISSYRRYQHYALYFKRYDDLEPEEREVFLNMGYQEEFNPVLKHFRWETHATKVSEADLEPLVIILENTYQLIKAVALGEITRTDRDFREVPTRIFNPETKECENFYFPFLEDLFRISPQSSINPDKLAGFQALEGNGMVVEYDLLYLPLKRGDELLALGVLWDVLDGKILEGRFVEVRGTREAAFMNLFLEHVQKYGVFLEVRCRDDIDRKLLASLNLPSKPKFAVGRLENVDRVVREVLAEYY